MPRLRHSCSSGVWLQRLHALHTCPAALLPQVLGGWGLGIYSAMKIFGKKEEAPAAA